MNYLFISKVLVLMSAFVSFTGCRVVEIVLPPSSTPAPPVAEDSQPTVYDIASQPPEEGEASFDLPLNDSPADSDGPVTPGASQDYYVRGVLGTESIEISYQGEDFLRNSCVYSVTHPTILSIFVKGSDSEKFFLSLSDNAGPGTYTFDASDSDDFTIRGKYSEAFDEYQLYSPLRTTSSPSSCSVQIISASAKTTTVESERAIAGVIACKNLYKTYDLLYGLQLKPLDAKFEFRCRSVLTVN